MAMRRAADLRISLNGVLYRCRVFSYQKIAPRIDLSNTESVPANPAVAGGLAGTRGPCRSHGGDISHTEIRISEPTFDDAFNIWIDHGISAETWAVLRAIPDGGVGVGRGFGPWNIYIESTKLSGEVGQGAMPVEIVACTDGEFFLDPVLFPGL